MLTGKPTGKRPLGRSRHRWEDRIRMDLKEIGVNMWNWVDLAQDSDYWRALMNAKLNWDQLVGKCENSRKTKRKEKKKTTVKK